VTGERGPELRPGPGAEAAEAFRLPLARAGMVQELLALAG